MCTGYSGCALIGKSDAGYGSASGTSFWGMTTGHNCTNYLAYRLTHGQLVARPAGTTDAGTWGTAASSAGIPVDNIPTKGSVAWWLPYAAPAGSRGHVAYVEDVLSDGSIVVSEDNLNGDFHWVQRSPGGTGWPSGFIHYPQSDGSPAGIFSALSSTVVGQIDFRGSASDPDVPGQPVDYLVTLGGARDDPTAEQFWFTTSYFNFHQIRNVHTRGWTEMYLYAANTSPTQGHDALLGRRWVSIHSASSTAGVLADATIRKTTRPRITIRVRSGSPSGTIVVKRGSTVIKKYTLSAYQSGKVTLALPRQSRGTKYLRVFYRGSSKYLPSRSSWITLKVR